MADGQMDSGRSLHSLKAKGYKASVPEGGVAQSHSGAAFLLLIFQQESPIHSPEETVYTQPNWALHGPEICMTAKTCTKNLGKVFSFPKRDLKMANR